ncbi:MAG: heat shock protein DnaJ-like protein [archaeon GW2011_AR9]|nr:MAG: heat shock protein DnaJ-like protein [archaeon GW2011_AR9]MBS3120956.1 J domain-containing protein [Candidatus Woesearchaeota archaeon]HIG92710.1 J domain-containing protein [Candidatus Woesearchaeota archaeon]HIH13587.1 J domain-containing protein [Candidatus Woesearchaeota archaeon]
MVTIKIKGYEITLPIIRDSYDRRAQQFRNNIIETLRKIGLTEDDINIKEEISAYRNAPASASWYVDGHHLYYSYKIARKYVENLYIVSKVIELEVKALLAGQKTIAEFIADFSEERDVEEKRVEARALLGVEDHVTDIAVINAKYKDLAKKNHPDMPGGDTERFKKINNAHKMLKRELE